MSRALRGETVGKGVDNVPSGQNGIDQDPEWTHGSFRLKARVGLIWGNKLYRNGVLVPRPHPHALACVQVWQHQAQISDK
jgi:hypothetical protein